MAISDELTRIQTAKADIKASIEAKGVTVPSSALIDEYADYVDEIQTGGGGQAEQDLIDLIERDITSITIPSGITTIGNSAFRFCSGLTTVTIPSSVTSIGSYAFQGCNLATITIQGDITSMGNSGTMFGGSNITAIIDSGVTVIANNMFDNCSGLTSIVMPNTLISIGNYAFSNCSGLTTVTIPNSVTSIGNSAFYYCRNLTSVTVEATTPPTLGSNALTDTSNCPIYVPAESVETYKTTGNWVTYADRIQAIPSE